MLHKHKTMEWPSGTKEQPLQVVQQSEAQDGTSPSVAALLPEPLSPPAQDLDKRIVALLALYKNTELRVLDDAHTILSICAGLWAMFISRRWRKKNRLYLWVIAWGIILGLVVELSLQIAALMAN